MFLINIHLLSHLFLSISSQYTTSGLGQSDVSVLSLTNSIPSSVSGQPTTTTLLSQTQTDDVWDVSYSYGISASAQIQKLVVYANITAVLTSDRVLSFYRITNGIIASNPARTLNTGITDFEIYSTGNTTSFGCFVIQSNSSQGVSTADLVVYNFASDLSYTSVFDSGTIYDTSSRVKVDNGYGYLYVIGSSVLHKYDVLNLISSPLLVTSNFVSDVFNTGSLTFCMDGCLQVIGSNLYGVATGLPGIYVIDGSQSASFNGQVVLQDTNFDSLFLSKNSVNAVSTSMNGTVTLTTLNKQTYAVTKNATLATVYSRFISLDSFTAGTSASLANGLIFDDKLKMVSNFSTVSSSYPAFVYGTSKMVLIDKSTPSIDVYDIRKSGWFSLQTWFPGSEFGSYGKPKSPFFVSYTNILQNNTVLAPLFQQVLDLVIDPDGAYETDAVTIVFKGFSTSSSVVTLLKYFPDFGGWYSLNVNSQLTIADFASGNIMLQIDQSSVPLLMQIRFPVTISFDVSYTRGLLQTVSISVDNMYPITLPASSSRSSTRGSLTVSATSTTDDQDVSQTSSGGTDFVSNLESSVGGFVPLVLIFGLGVVALAATFGSVLWCFRNKQEIKETKQALDSLAATKQITKSGMSYAGSEPNSNIGYGNEPSIGRSSNYGAPPIMVQSSLPPPPPMPLSPISPLSPVSPIIPPPNQFVMSSVPPSPAVSMVPSVYGNQFTSTNRPGGFGLPSMGRLPPGIGGTGAPPSPGFGMGGGAQTLPRSHIVAPVLASPVDLRWQEGEFSVVNRIKTGINGNEIYEGELSSERSSQMRVSKCIIKILKGYEHFDEGNALAGMLQEVGIMYVFRDHPNFVKLYGYSQTPFSLCQQYCSKGSLDDYIPSMTQQMTIQIAKDVAEFLSAFHIAGFVHNSLKPSNILLNVDAFGQVRALIGDFGHATFADTALQKANGDRKGKKPTTYARYSAPELLMGSETNPEFIKSTDIYSFGVCLFEMLALEKAWNNSTDAMVVTTMVTQGQRPQMPSHRMSTIVTTPALNGLFQLMSKAWEQNPSMRPTAEEVKIAVYQF